MIPSQGLCPCTCFAARCSAASCSLRCLVSSLPWRIQIRRWDPREVLDPRFDWPWKRDEDINMKTTKKLGSRKLILKRRLSLEVQEAGAWTTNPQNLPGQVAVNPSFLLQRVLPVGVAFATSLICSNVAYEYVTGQKIKKVQQTGSSTGCTTTAPELNFCFFALKTGWTSTSKHPSKASVPFLQMVKQSNVIIVFVLSLLIGLEKLPGVASVLKHLHESSDV